MYIKNYSSGIKVNLHNIFRQLMCKYKRALHKKLSIKIKEFFNCIIL